MFDTSDRSADAYLFSQISYSARQLALRFTTETLERLAVPAGWVARRDALSDEVEAAIVLGTRAALLALAAVGYGASEDPTQEGEHGGEADG